MHNLTMLGRTLSAACFAFCSLSPVAEAGDLNVAVAGDVASLDPHVLNETFTLGILSNVMEGLIRRDHRLRIKPALATPWQQLNSRHWRFHLRRGVRFHDGRPFSADDVVFSFERARKPRSQLKSRLPGDARIVKVDRHTVDIHLSTPNPVLHTNWETLLIMSAGWARENGLEEPSQRQTLAGPLPVNGTGPFRVTHHRPGEKTVFERNRKWWQKPPHNLTSVTMHTVRNATTRTAALLSGQVDLVVPAPIRDLERIRRAAGFKIETGPELRTIFLNLDQFRATPLYGAPGSANPLRDARVRRAIYHAIDVDAIARTVMRGYATPAATLVSPIIHPGVAAIKRLPFNPARARKLLREAGYGDGFELPMDCPNDRYINDRQICLAIAGMLARIGIRVPLDIQTKSLFFAKVLSGGGYRSSFSLIGWTPGSLDAYDVLANVANCRDAAGNGARFNLGGYCNREVDRLTAMALIELDHGRRARLLNRAFEIIHEDAGFIPLHQQNLAWAMSSTVDVQVRADNQIHFHTIRKRATSESRSGASTQRPN